MDTLHLDHLGPMPSTNKNYKHILPVVDAFTKFCWIFPTKSTTASEVVQKMKLLSETFGNPRRIVADRGSAFTSNEFREYCEGENIELLWTTTGVPRGNGHVERMHRTIISVLTKLSIDNPQKWYTHTADVQKYLNGTFCRSISTSLFELMFGARKTKYCASKT